MAAQTRQDLTALMWYEGGAGVKGYGDHKGTDRAIIPKGTRKKRSSLGQRWRSGGDVYGIAFPPSGMRPSPKLRRFSGDLA